MQGASTKTKREEKERSFQTAGPKLPDEPKIGGAMPLNCEKSNSVIHQVERGEWKSVDPAGGHHVSKADRDDMLLVLTVHA